MSLVKVARAAGVSTATVSRVLNDLPVVSNETVALVRAAAAELNYIPGAPRRRERSAPALSSIRPASRSPRTTRTTSKTIGIITIGHDRSWLRLPIISAVVAGVHRGAAELGWSVMLDEHPDAKDVYPLIESGQIQGAVVFIASDLDPAVAAAAIKRIRSKIPVVWALGGDSNPRNIDRITVDNVGVGLVAFDHLLSLGCKKLAYLTTRPDWGFMRQRYHAFASAACDAGLSVTSYLQHANPLAETLFGSSSVVADSLSALVAKLIETRNRPDGLFVGNDFVAAQVQPLLLSHGIRVGKDLHLVSCDNELSRLVELQPRLTSIDVRPEEVGVRSVLRLSTLLERPDEAPLVVQLPPRLVVPH